MVMMLAASSLILYFGVYTRGHILVPKLPYIVSNCYMGFGLLN
uniref:Uncharacterized protein n=1 Tax=Arundo donax TaxID=35708 RepID=A0A0A9EC78_ARUDO